jgi:hypothetical protein
LLVSQVLCGLRCPCDPLTWRTTLGTRPLGCKAHWTPALPDTRFRLRGRYCLYHHTCFVPLPLSHLLGEVDDYRVSRVRHLGLTIAASVAFASWAYGSPSRLARVPTELDLMPTVQGYLRRFGWVRTRLPYQTWRASLALRHGLAPRPYNVIGVSWSGNDGTSLEHAHSLPRPRRD